jgi:hypothetical protein
MRHTFIALALVSFAVTSQAGILRKLSGPLQIIRGGQVMSATEGMRVKEGDELQSSSDSEALLRFDDGARLVVRSDSKLTLDKLQLKGKSAVRQKTVRIVKGGLRYVSGKTTAKQKVAFVTATATMGIRGTDIEISVVEEPLADNNAGTYLKVNSGAAVIKAVDGDQVEVAPGEVAFGGEPDLTPRALGVPKRPSARKQASLSALSSAFKGSKLDALLK